ncbi:MAG: glycosyltransferase family 2 protein [Lentisphaeria bacterium]|nr:glycosyltransferase family 2 protein [Lentisphaeria bacterium]
MKLSVIMPVYNEEKTVLEVVERVMKVPLDIELVIVNDCSSDGTAEELKKLNGRENITVIHHPHNQGKGAGIRSAQKVITGDVMIIQDADLEYSPEEFTKLFRLFQEEKADVVYGSRYSGTELLVDTFWHYMGNKVLTSYSNILSNLHLTDMETCYKMIRADIFKEIDIECNCFGFEPEVTAKLAKQNIKIWEVPINYEARRFDEGKKIGWRDGVKAFYYITKYNLFTR